jgi:folate-binding protein YgfZ
MDIFLVKPIKFKEERKKINLKIIDDEMFVVVDKEFLSEFAKLIKRYSFKRNLEMVDLTEDFRVSRFWPVPLLIQTEKSFCGKLFKEFYEDIPKKKMQVDHHLDVSFFDPRNSSLGNLSCFVFSYLKGVMMIHHKDNKISNNFENSETQIQKLIPKDFQILRLKYNIFSAKETKEQLPILCNYDLTSSIHFDKGCYLGQETSARQFFTGKDSLIFLI